MGLFRKARELGGEPSKRLLQSPHKAPARILEMADTGTYVGANQYPVIHFKLKVANVFGEPGDSSEIEHRQWVPQSMLGQLAPGVTVLAGVDEGHPGEVALIWAGGVHRRGQLDVSWVNARNVEVERASARADEALSLDDPLAAIATMNAGDAKRVQASQAQQAQATMTEPATATILSVEALGPVGQFTQMLWRVKVAPESGAPGFELPYKAVCSDRIMALAVPGVSFPAHYDPSSQSDVDIHMPPAPE